MSTTENRTEEAATSSLTIVSQNTQRIELSPAMQETIKEALLIYLRTNKEVVRELIAESFPDEEIELKTIPKDQAKKLIMELIETNVGIKTSEIITKSCLEPTLVMDVLQELGKEEKVRSEPTNTK